MKIAVDAMGGDHAPEAPVAGALLALPRCSAQLVLVGHEERLQRVLGTSRATAGMEILHAPESIGMEEAGPLAIRRKRASSLSVAMRLLSDQQVDAVVSAGNTAAIVAASRYLVGLLPGLRRPAMIVPVPTPSGNTVLIDAGAQAEAHPIHLAHSAAMARSYLKVRKSLDNPRIGLLNIGHEPLKGMRVIRRTFELLKRSSLNFIGNIEPQDLFSDRTNVAVCDGFVGNMLIKMFEGLSEKLVDFLIRSAENYQDPVRSGVGEILEDFERMYHYQNIGGAPLLGVRRPVVVAHGRSRSKAIASAILTACDLAGEKVYERMSDEMEKEGSLTELRHLNTMLILENLRNQVRLHSKKESDSF